MSVSFQHRSKIGRCFSKSNSGNVGMCRVLGNKGLSELRIVFGEGKSTVLAVSWHLKANVSIMLNSTTTIHRTHRLLQWQKLHWLLHYTVAVGDSDVGCFSVTNFHALINLPKFSIF